MAGTGRTARTCHRGGISLIEVLVVISIIGILAGMTFTALSGVGGTDTNLRSRHNLRQIHTWMEAYSSNHQDRIVPSQFDYFDENGEAVGGVASRTGYSNAGSAEVDWVPSNNLFNNTGDCRADFVSQGTWADIIWVESNLGDDVGLADLPLTMPGGGGVSPGNEDITVSYRYRAPNRHIYDFDDSYSRNPLRSMAANTYNFPHRTSAGGEVQVDPSMVGQTQGGQPLGLPKPFGAGAWEKGYPGFFAANNFFDARSQRDIDPSGSGSTIDRYVTIGQLRAPARSMYLVDSFAGLTIGGGPNDEMATANAFRTQMLTEIGVLDGQVGNVGGGTESTQEVDFRYAGGQACLMLFLDGHVEQVGEFGGLKNLQGGDVGKSGRGIRVTDLDRRKSEVPK
ncbi:MAG: type II secretion system GspH family protein [Phycisphaerales bacterium]|nr:type II secretion system GspH family protein [Phycisphaerales bacterium]